MTTGFGNWITKFAVASVTVFTFFSVAPIIGKTGVQAAGFKWVAAKKGAVPRGAIIGGRERGRNLPICRTKYKGGTYPGKIVDQHCNIGWGGKEIRRSQYQVLVSKGSKARWLAHKNGSKPRNAFIGGKERSRKLPVCRAKYKKGTHPGKIVGRHCNIGWGGKEIRISKYQVLVLTQDTPKPVSMACLNAKPTSALVTYGGRAKPVNVRIEAIMPKCLRFNYSGSAMWTRASAAGGVSCAGKAVKIDYSKANSAFNGIKVRRLTPTACGRKTAPPKAAPVAKGPKINVYYGKTIDMASVPLRMVTAKCYEISYSGNKMWFPKSAYKSRTDFVGNPPGLDYNVRRDTPCGVKPAPIPPVASATSPCPPCNCLNAKPTSALVTYGGRAKPENVRIEAIMPKCVRFNYGGSAMWTKASSAGGISCVGKAVQIDYGKANRAFNGIRLRKYTPAACGRKKAPPKSVPMARGPRINVYYGKSIDMASVPLRKVTAKCYEISYSGNKMWFPKSAYKYRTDFVGNPPGLNYNARRNQPC